MAEHRFRKAGVVSSNLTFGFNHLIYSGLDKDAPEGASLRFGADGVGRGRRRHSTVTLLAKLRGLSTLQPRITAAW
jgi:hypothetical protein